MKICIFGAASDNIDSIYIETVEHLGELMAHQGHSLVFGAGKTGLMGAAARGIKRAGGYCLGVVPDFFKNGMIEVLYNNCDKVIYTETMRERKGIMEDESDAFIITPGGVGTFDEMFEIITLKQLGRHNKPIIILNINGYYDAFKSLMQSAFDGKFVSDHTIKMYEVVSTPEEALAILNS